MHCCGDGRVVKYVSFPWCSFTGTSCRPARPLLHLCHLRAAPSPVLALCCQKSRVSWVDAVGGGTAARFPFEMSFVSGAPGPSHGLATIFATKTSTIFSATGVTDPDAIEGPTCTGVRPATLGCGVAFSGVRGAAAVTAPPDVHRPTRSSAVRRFGSISEGRLDGAYHDEPRFQGRNRWAPASPFCGAPLPPRRLLFAHLGFEQVAACEPTDATSPTKPQQIAVPWGAPAHDFKTVMIRVKSAALCPLKSVFDGAPGGGCLVDRRCNGCQVDAQPV